MHHRRSPRSTAPRAVVIAAVGLLAAGFPWGRGVAAAAATEVTLALDPAPGLERALRSAWEDALGREDAAATAPEAPLPPAVYQAAPQPRLSLRLTRAQDAWAWARALAPAGPSAELVIRADPPEQAALGPDVPATLDVTLAPAALAEARRQALTVTRDLVVRRLSTIEGIERVGHPPGDAGETVVLTVVAPSLASDRLRAAVEAALPVHAAQRLRLVAVAPAEHARTALEEALAAWQATVAEGPPRLQVSGGPAPTVELVGGDASLARAVAAQPRRPGERLALVVAAPGAGRQAFVLLRGPALVDVAADLLDAAVDVTASFEPIVRVDLGPSATRQLAELARDRGGAPLALVHGAEVVALYRARGALARDFLELPAASRRDGAVEDRVRAFAAVLRDAPAGARAVLRSVSATVGEGG